VLSQQLPLNAIPDAYNGLPPGGHVHAPHLGHTRTNSGGSTGSNLSASSRKSARFSPNLTANPPVQIHNPPPPGATPVRSAMRQTPSPFRNSPQYRFPAASPNMGSPPSIHIIHPTPPSPTSPTSFRVQPSRWGGSSSDDGSDSPTPGQQVFRSSPSPNLRNGTSPVQRQSPGGQFDDSGYFSPQSSVGAKSHAHILATQTRQQSQGAGNTSSHKNRVGGTTATNQSQPGASPSQVNQSASNHRQSRSQFHTSWQAPRSPHTCSPVIPVSSQSLGNSSQSHTNRASSPDLVRSPSAVHTPARSTHRLTNRNLPRMNTLFDHTAAGQPSGHPRSSHTRPCQHTPYGPTRAVLTPANGDGNGNIDVNSVVSDLFRVPPSSVAWQTPRGVLTWTPHPGLPDSGPSLLGGGGGGGNGIGGRVGNPDCWTGGYPMPGACATWTPGTWPPASSSATTGRRAVIQLAPWMIPNPCNAAMPHIMWDISQLPTTAKRITGNHVITNVTDKLDDVATNPAVDRLVVVCQVGVAQSLWGCIDVRASRPKGVTVWDVFNGVYEYFQKRIGRRELGRMKEMLGDERLEEKMADAFYQRILITPALPGYELKEGLKRVDCLGDASFFWGLYVSYNDDNTWQLNLGLVNRRRQS